MRQYWINFKGNQQGPMSIDQLAQLGLDESAYVWHSGLPDWVKITSVPELSMLLSGNAQPTEQHPEAASEEVPELPEQEPETTGEDVPSLDNVVAEPAHPQQVAPVQYQQYQQQGVPLEEAPKCPPTNLVWSIIATVLCCSIPGIVGIVFAFLTKKYYREGNLDKAQRMSDYGAWAVILSIMLGLISMPLSCAMNIFKMAM